SRRGLSSPCRESLASDSLLNPAVSSNVAVTFHFGRCSMSSTATAGLAPIRVVRRQPVRPTVTVTIRLTRPSFLDLRLQGDPWIVDRGAETLGLFFNSWELTSVRGMPVDVPGFNQLLDRLRHRRPRRRC